MKNTKMTIALLVILTFTMVLTVFPLVNALDIDTYAFLVVAPNPVGVGQTVTISMWLSNTPVLDPVTMWTIPWEGLEITITKPDGNTQILGPFNSDPVGGTWTQFNPDQTGTYSLQFTFPGQTVNGISFFGLSGEHYYKPSVSSLVELTVQQDPIQVTSEVPLPEDYWERPIYGENRDWWKISGNWLMAKYDKDAVGFEYSGNWNRYTTAPNTAHILWTKELTFGGIVGGEYGPGLGYYTGLQYEPRFRPPIIINGILYHDIADPPRYGFEAVDLRTGETLWHQNSTYQLSFGQILDYESPNQHGAIPYLWSRVGSTCHMFDAFTGNWILSIENVPSGYMRMGPNGEILIYTLNTQGHWLSMWNSSKAIPAPSATGTGSWQWRPDNYRGQTLNGTVGIEWNVTGNTAPAGSSFQWYWGDVLISQAIIRPPDQPWPILAHVAFNAQTGQQIWAYNRTDMGAMGFPGYITPNEGVYALFVRETKQWVAWDVTTGVELWRTTPIENDWGFYEYCAGFAYGKFYSSGYDGTIHAYDATTGKHLWDYYAGDAGFDTPYGSWPLFGAIIFADGKIIVATNEHSPSMPLWRGEKLHVVDGETGMGVWNISGMYTGGRNGLGAVADGYLVTSNVYDNRIYCFGRGKTEITIEAPLTAISLGSSVLLRGTVTDQSPGAEGTPAIADEYMTEWMEYLYMQQVCPNYVEGVEVVLETLDPNNNFYEIGRTTSDASGFYSLMWEPPVPGKYTILATFEGSESYWRSHTETAIGVTEAPSTAQPIEPEPLAPAPAEPAPVEPSQPATAFVSTELNPTEPTQTAEVPLISTEIAILLAATIIAIALLGGFWILGKRK